MKLKSFGTGKNSESDFKKGLKSETNCKKSRSIIFTSDEKWEVNVKRWLDDGIVMIKMMDNDGWSLMWVK